MAGIGFRLQKLIRGDSYTSLFQAYLYSAIISTGPLIIMVVSLGFVNRLALNRLSIEDAELIQGLIMYVYAFSLVGAGTFLYVVTRYLADKYYEKNVLAFTPTYLTILEVIFTVQAVLAIPFLAGIDLPLSTKWMLLALFLSVTGIWVAMVFLSAARNYLGIVLAFVVGGVAGAVATYYYGLETGIEGYIQGFTMGQVLTFLILTTLIFVEFGYDVALDYGVFLYFRRYPYLTIVGATYYLGIWLDKFVFWASDEGHWVADTIRICNLYDVPVFVAFMTIVPSMAFFLIQMETSFVRHYRAYFDDIRDRKSLSTINVRLDNIMYNIASNMERFLVFQGLITALSIIFLQEISGLVRLTPSQMGIFRISVLGAFLQMGWIMLINILFYFDFHRDAAIITSCFLLTNWLFSLISTYMGLPAYGFGYTLANFATLTLAVALVNYKLKHLNYWVFMKQPIVIPKFQFEKEKIAQGPKFKESPVLSSDAK
jgi:uncharacterized membrane protein